MLKVLDLFSGIGGFSLGLESTGYFKTIGFVEKDKFCQKVLKKNFKDIPIIGDIRDVKGSEFKADVITGGFPCQSISIAGKQKGRNDDRYLFPEMLKVIKEVRPRWIIGENVQNLINISNGTILKEIIKGLEAENFEVQCFSISASSQGAWHKRERIWIVANSNDRFSIGKDKKIQTRRNTIDNGSSSNVSNSKCYKRQDTSTRQSRAGELWRFHSAKEKQTSHDLWSKTSRCDAPLGKQKNVSNTNKFGTQVQTQRQHSSIKMSGSSGKKNWWQIESELCGVPDGVSYELDKNRANRIKALGNSIVPQIAKEIGQAIIAAEMEK